MIGACLFKQNTRLNIQFTRYNTCAALTPLDGQSRSKYITNIETILYPVVTVNLFVPDDFHKLLVFFHF